MLEFLFNKVPAHQACNFIKKKLLHWCFPLSSAKFLRTPILKNIRKQLLLSPILFLILSKIGTRKVTVLNKRFIEYFTIFFKKGFQKKPVNQLY